MSLDVQGLLHRIEAAVLPLATAERAESERKYLKSDLRFLGVTLPALRRETLAALKAAGPLDRQDLSRLAEACWASDLHEHRSIGCIALEAQARRLTAEDLPWLEGLLRRSHTWAYVDTLAVHAVGPLVARQPEAVKPVLRRWATDADFWLRRSALLALLGENRAKKPFDAELFEALAVPMLAEKEFFVRKAIGWVLRDVARKSPQVTQTFLDRHGPAMAGLSRREAEKGLARAHSRQEKTEA